MDTPSEARPQVRSEANNCHRWVIVLAGGEGQRMRPAIEAWLGSECPKQYCAFVGTRSMLEHTLARAAQVTDPGRIVTVIGAGHRDFLRGQCGWTVGRILEQPTARGTAAGILLPAACILSVDPEATFVVLPSDHFVFPEDRFVDHLQKIAALAQGLEERIVLLGAVPNRAEADYGWIGVPSLHARFGGRPRVRPLPVWSFHEKPSRSEAERFLHRGYLWNTFVMAFKGSTLWSLGRKLLPRMMMEFEKLRRALETIYGGGTNEPGSVECITSFLSKTYQTLETVDFSQQFLQRAADRTLVQPLTGVYWSDWGRPDRIRESLARLGMNSRLPI